MKLVSYKKVGQISYLKINRPEKRNAINQEMYVLFMDGLKQFKEDQDSRVLIISGEGEKAFCSGIDLNEPAFRGITPAFAELFEGIIKTWKPVISAINGVAVGAGCEIALASDIRISSMNSLIGMPEAKRGMGATFGSVLLPRIIPPGRASQMLFTGELMTAPEAKSINLVNEVLPDNTSLLERADEIARSIVKCAPLSVQRMKETMWKTMDMPLFQATQLNVGPDVYSSQDRIEGARAFKEKRDPVWQGR
jgi:enoyl-CoA hydratase